MDINRLIEISSDLRFSELTKELEGISKRESQENCPLILPLVGEFSSGKTTLINALTDCKKLETATKPTTATIYEVHFGANKCCATVLSEDGIQTEVEDLTELKNDILKDAKVVTVFDTSKKVPSSTILVDTPGLSSPDPKHKQTLVDFLPHADAILLVSDVNQQITRSLTDFIKTMSLSKRPVYLVLTKCDTKASAELQSVKKYISDNIQINLEHVICVSANSGDLKELYHLFDNIQRDKGRILRDVNEQRVKNIVVLLKDKIQDLLTSENLSGDLEDAINQKKRELDKLNKNIDRLMDAMISDIDEEARKATRLFEDRIFDRLDSIVSSSSNNFDSDALSAVNNTSSLIFNDFKTNVQSILRKKTAERSGTDNAVNLHSLSELNFDQYSTNGMCYNLDLNSIGHEYDDKIATGVKIAGAVALVATAGAVLAGAGGAAGAGSAVAAGEAGGAAAAGEVGTVALSASQVSTAVSVADSATDVASMVSNHKAMKKMKQYSAAVGQGYGEISQFNQNLGKQMGANNGLIESVVGFVTERTWGKPQRRRAIHTYLDDTLLPCFKSEISDLSRILVEDIRKNLHNEAATSISEMTNALEELQRNKTDKKEAYERKMTILKGYMNELTTL